MKKILAGILTLSLMLTMLAVPAMAEGTMNDTTAAVTAKGGPGGNPGGNRNQMPGQGDQNNGQRGQAPNGNSDQNAPQGQAPSGNDNQNAPQGQAPSGNNNQNAPKGQAPNGKNGRQAPGNKGNDRRAPQDQSTDVTEQNAPEKPEGELPPEAPAKNEVILDDNLLAKLVASGILTQEQADAISTLVSATDTTTTETVND